MRKLIKTLAICGLTGIGAGCTVPPGTDPGLLSDNPGAARALWSCPRAIATETNASGITLNTDIVIVELNQYIFDVPGQERPWTCVTDDAGAAQYIYPTRVIQG